MSATGLALVAGVDIFTAIGMGFTIMILLLVLPTLTRRARHKFLSFMQARERDMLRRKHWGYN